MIPPAAADDDDDQEFDRVAIRTLELRARGVGYREIARLLATELGPPFTPDVLLGWIADRGGVRRRAEELAAAEIRAERVPPPWPARPRPSTREEAELIRASRSYRRLVKALAGRCP